MKRKITHLSKCFTSNRKKKRKKERKKNSYKKKGKENGFLTTFHFFDPFCSNGSKIISLVLLIALPIEFY